MAAEEPDLLVITSKPPSAMRESCEFAATQDQPSIQSQTDERIFEKEHANCSREYLSSCRREHRSLDRVKQKHNTKEKIRRQGLKDSIHTLRNQLKVHKAKRTTTISVLKAARIEIQDLKSNEWKQKDILDKLKYQNEDLLQKIKDLRAGCDTQQHEKPPEDTAESRHPASIELSPNLAPTSIIDPYNPAVPVFPFSPLPGTLPYYSTTAHHAVRYPLLNSTPLPIYSSCSSSGSNLWFPQLAYPNVALPGCGFGPLPVGGLSYPIYSCVDRGFGHSEQMPNVGEVEREGKSLSLDGEDEEVMVDIEGDWTEENSNSDTPSCDMQVTSGSKVEVAMWPSGANEDKQQLQSQLPPSPPGLTTTHADMGIVFVTDITGQMQPVRQHHIMRQTAAYTLDSLSKALHSQDNQVLRKNSCTKHTAALEISQPAFLGQTPFPPAYSYRIL